MLESTRDSETIAVEGPEAIHPIMQHGRNVYHSSVRENVEILLVRQSDNRQKYPKLGGDKCQTGLYKTL